MFNNIYLIKNNRFKTMILLNEYTLQLTYFVTSKLKHSE